MGELTGIAWTRSTYSHWRGCTALASPSRAGSGCDHCYAEALVDGRFKEGAFGPRGRRVRVAGSSVSKVRSWNRQAAKTGERWTVFFSLGDPFDNAVPDEWRADFWGLIRDTPALEWLLLTKRPGNMPSMLPNDWGDGYANVRLGVTVENQVELERRVPALFRIPHRLAPFLSAEPLLERLDLRAVSQFMPIRLGR